MTEKTLLILDDEPSILNSLKSFFEDEGFLVYTAENGALGIKCFFEHSIDVVITDLRMPEKDGFEVMAAIQEASPDTPILVISGADDKTDVIKALRLGAKDYITKPVQDIEMIIHSVNYAFETHRLNQENIRYRKALEKSEQHYRTIAENIAEGMFTMDAKACLTYVNNTFCVMTGYRKEQLLGMNLEQICKPDSVTVLQEELNAPAKGENQRFDIEIVHSSGKPVHAELAYNPIFSSRGVYQGGIVIARDITELTILRQKFKDLLSRPAASSEDVVAICASCKNIKLTEEAWIPIEDHFSEIFFSHGICPECCEKLYPQFDFNQLTPKDKSS